MKQALLIAIFLLFICGTVFAQENNSPCPVIKIAAPQSISMFGESVAFSVSANKDLQPYNPEYQWTVSAGRIVEGQDASSIKVISQKGGVEIKATVKIKGIPKECVNTASETAVIAEQIRDYFPEEYGKLSLKEEFIRLDIIMVRLLNYPKARAFVHIYLYDTENIEETRKHIKQLVKHIKYRKFPISRFIFVIEKSHKHLTVIEIFSENFTLPECKNCEVVKGKNFE